MLFFQMFCRLMDFFAKTCFVQLFDVDETHVERCMHTHLFFLLSATPAAVHAGDCVLP